MLSSLWFTILITLWEAGDDSSEYNEVMDRLRTKKGVRNKHRLYDLSEKYLRRKHTDIIDNAFHEYYNHTGNLDTGMTKLFYHYLYSRFCKELCNALGLESDESAKFIRRYFEQYSVMSALYKSYGYGNDTW